MIYIRNVLRYLFGIERPPMPWYAKINAVFCALGILFSLWGCVLVGLDRYLGLINLEEWRSILIANGLLWIVLLDGCKSVLEKLNSNYLSNSSVDPAGKVTFTPAFYQTRQALFGQLDNVLERLTMSKINIGDHPNIKHALGLSSKSIIHNWDTVTDILLATHSKENRWAMNNLKGGLTIHQNGTDLESTTGLLTFDIDERTLSKQTIKKWAQQKGHGSGIKDGLGVNYRHYRLALEYHAPAGIPVTLKYPNISIDDDKWAISFWPYL